MSPITRSSTVATSRIMAEGYDRIIEHCCRELRLTREGIATRFNIRASHIEPEHIKALWLEYLRKR